VPVRDGAVQRGVPVPVPYVDVLCGGFPCQDISLAGRGAGLAGERSGLWREFARLIGELRPRYVLVENVPALTSRGLDVVLADLAACGFDAEWDHLPASAFGAPHRRDRIWLVAYPGAVVLAGFGLGWLRGRRG
jgi:DNA (cytosine-5)-methyltransferase 1